MFNQPFIRLESVWNYNLKHMELISQVFPVVAQADQDNSQLILQILNVSGFVIAMVINGGSQGFMKYSLSDITNQWDARIDPAGYAFSIWGLIYSLLGVFTIYQALPDSMVPTRNNDLVFGQINYLFFANMLINSIWLVLFQTNTLWGFAAGLVDIIAMLATNVYIMWLSTNDSVNVYEWIGLRGGFSIYAGWVTAATILNAVYFLKAAGMADPNILWGFDEENITVIILWIAFGIYTMRSYWDRNPLYGSVLMWVILAIRNNIVNNKAQYTSISDAATQIAIIHGISMVGLWSWVSAEAWYDVSGIEGWNNKGIWY